MAGSLPPDVANLLADEFIEFGSSGRVFNKQQTIASLQHKSFARISITEFNTSVLAVGVIIVDLLRSQVRYFYWTIS
ncbi:nuclear transport factor 2 family protein [Chroococcidiopsis sp. TS-821]|uniref:nuclear transport factor 2 family protein n=1 Tax=Chroococcidiopsis sp. TS-821 TaxID=1378066 RepID=UPI000CEEC991|nr:nuclear transport factor 2 family protein [Chroococcidiopsis sp. TS-821]PPS44269.1 hypothetical protein B1A85_09925 [Chroococcidiopsis sp. TS-821]